MKKERNSLKRRCGEEEEFNQACVNVVSCSTDVKSDRGTQTSKENRVSQGKKQGCQIDRERDNCTETKTERERRER